MNRRSTLVLVWRDPSRTEETVRCEGDIRHEHEAVVFVPVTDDPNRRTWRVVPLANLWEYRITQHL